MFNEQSFGQTISEYKPESDKDGFVNFGDVSRKLLNKQCQYGSRYLGGWEQDGYPNLSEGLRIQGKVDNYYDLRIHQDDIAEFVKRVKEYEDIKKSGM